METKKCTKCEKEKEISNFAKKYKTKDGIQKYSSICKKCVNSKDRERRNTKEYKKYKSKYDNQYYKENKDEILENKKDYHIKNKKSILLKKQEYRNKPENKERAKNYIKEYRKLHPDKYYSYRRKNPHIIAWRRLLYRTLSYTGKEKQDETLIELGYSAVKLKHHLEKSFKDGMTWENYGKEWEIDHIKPLTSFDENTLPKIVNALSNLQPLWWYENRQKYNNKI